jgi:hypothetical protein
LQTRSAVRFPPPFPDTGQTLRWLSPGYGELTGLQVAFGVGTVTGTVVVGSGGVIRVVGTVVTGDGRGSGAPGVITGVGGVGMTGGEIVPETGGGRGIGMLTGAGGMNGAVPVGEVTF